jgi:hypothetical protein
MCCACLAFRLKCLLLIFGCAIILMVVQVLAQSFHPKPTPIDSLTRLIASSKPDSLKGY